jgi:methylated-DNA-protein-cysteine methyltransferase-like protein
MRKPPRRSAARAAVPTTYERIYAVVRRIPRGRVATYGDVAALAGMERQARLVGYALHAAPEGARLPWHRVVNAQGRISLGRGLAGGDLSQRFRLEREGVRFDPSGRLPLGDYRWDGSSRRGRRK